MSDRIKVHVVQVSGLQEPDLPIQRPADRQACAEIIGHGQPKDARKAAGRWEDELNSGKARGRYADHVGAIHATVRARGFAELGAHDGQEGDGRLLRLGVDLAPCQERAVAGTDRRAAERVASRATQTRPDGSDDLRPPGPPTGRPGVGGRSRATCRPSEDEAAQACQAKRWGRSDEGQADQRRRV